MSPQLRTCFTWRPFIPSFFSPTVFFFLFSLAVFILECVLGFLYFFRWRFLFCRLLRDFVPPVSVEVFLLSYFSEKKKFDHEVYSPCFIFELSICRKREKESCRLREKDSAREIE
jgi:hypothetical protein